MLVILLYVVGGLGVLAAFAAYLYLLTYLMAKARLIAHSQVREQERAGLLREIDALTREALGEAPTLTEKVQ